MRLLLVSGTIVMVHFFLLKVSATFRYAGSQITKELDDQLQNQLIETCHLILSHSLLNLLSKTLICLDTLENKSVSGVSPNIAGSLQDFNVILVVTSHLTGQGTPWQKKILCRKLHPPSNQELFRVFAASFLRKPP